MCVFVWFTVDDSGTRFYFQLQLRGDPVIIWEVPNYWLLFQLEDLGFRTGDNMVPSSYIYILVYCSCVWQTCQTQATWIWKIYEHNRLESKKHAELNFLGYGSHVWCQIASRSDIKYDCQIQNSWVWHCC